LRQASNRF